jgi:hypothetical protein
LQRDLAVLARWQSQRLAETYADLEQVGRYRRAMAFFLDDLYGPHDFTRRDADLERITPMLASMLPGRVLQTVGCAVEVNALTGELDIGMLEAMGPPDRDGRLVTVARYCRAYRASGRAAERRHQIDLIDAVGRALDHYVNMPFLHSALKMMRFPARIAGFGELQDFLERGFDSFAGIGGADHFLGTIRERELALMERILGGDDAPFPEPSVEG